MSFTKSIMPKEVNIMFFDCRLLILIFCFPVIPVGYPPSITRIFTNFFFQRGSYFL